MRGPGISTILYLKITLQIDNFAGRRGISSTAGTVSGASLSASRCAARRRAAAFSPISGRETTSGDVLPDLLLDEFVFRYTCFLFSSCEAFVPDCTDCTTGLVECDVCSFEDTLPSGVCKGKLKFW